MEKKTTGNNLSLFSIIKILEAQFVGPKYTDISAMFVANRKVSLEVGQGLTAQR